MHSAAGQWRAICKFLSLFWSFRKLFSTTDGRKKISKSCFLFWRKCVALKILCAASPTSPFRQLQKWYFRQNVSAHRGWPIAAYDSDQTRHTHVPAGRTTRVWAQSRSQRESVFSAWGTIVTAVHASSQLTETIVYNNWQLSQLASWCCFRCRLHSRGVLANHLLFRKSTSRYRISISISDVFRVFWNANLKFNHTNDVSPSTGKVENRNLKTDFCFRQHLLVLHIYFLCVISRSKTFQRLMMESLEWTHTRYSEVHSNSWITINGRSRLSSFFQFFHVFFSALRTTKRHYALFPVDCFPLYCEHQHTRWTSPIPENVLGLKQYVGLELKQSEMVACLHKLNQPYLWQRTCTYDMCLLSPQVRGSQSLTWKFTSHVLKVS